MNKKERIMRWIQTEGVQPCHDPEWTELLLKYLTPISIVFPDITQHVSAWYAYRMTEQAYTLEFEDTAGKDAIHWYMATKDESEVIHAIGISCEALLAGRKYSQMLILHELAHMLTSEDHSIRFHETLSTLINDFNAATGSEITNDLYGIETRYDSRPWTLPENIPVQQSQQGTQFRTEAKR